MYILSATFGERQQTTLLHEELLCTTSKWSACGTTLVSSVVNVAKSMFDVAVGGKQSNNLLGSLNKIHRE